MKYAAIIATTLALPYLSSAASCIIDTACCGLNYPNHACDCSSDSGSRYSPGEELNVMCSCENTVYNPTTGASDTYLYYADGSHTYVNAAYTTDCSGTINTCDACIPGQCTPGN